MLAMPTILKIGPYRFYFRSNEPPRAHIHCENNTSMCKWWLEKDGRPEISLKDSGNFSEYEIWRKPLDAA